MPCHTVCKEYNWWRIRELQNGDEGRASVVQDDRVLGGVVRIGNL